jgi:hypothetical protein
MNWMDLVYDVLKLCVIPMLGVLTTYAVKWLNAKEVETLNKVDNDLADKYLAMVFETIRDCVSATTQTYVDSLKKQNAFDMEAQKVAFQMTFDSVTALLTSEVKEYIAEAYGDLTSYLTTKIEAEVKAQK